MVNFCLPCTNISCFFIVENMVNQCTKCKQAFLSFDDRSMCAHCRFAAGLCLLEASQPCQVCKSWSLNLWRKLKKSLREARTKAVSRGMQHWISVIPSINTLLGVSLDFHLRSCFRDQFMKESVLDLNNEGNCDSNVGLDDNFIVSTMRVVGGLISASGTDRSHIRHYRTGRNSEYYGSSCAMHHSTNVCANADSGH